jgi:hypothetical protein
MSWLITGTQRVAQDPYLYTNTVLLLKGDGANGSTTILDSSKVAGGPKTVTAVGNAQISTAIADPFGNSTRGVIAFDGTGDRLTTPSDSAFAFGTADFTVEAWIRESSRGQYASLLEIGPHLGSGIIFLTNGGNNVNGNIGVYANGFIGLQAAGPLNSWNHVAYVRASGQLVCYVNGVGGAPASLTNNFTNTTTITIGSKDGGSPVGPVYDLSGYIDDLRITKGVARYTSNFTPPTAPFPDI